ncbi:uncharacterized protein LOC117175632 [Belonocnema kinseyi]|uniref:uncharacterized protein LOC117175632 n=1 Tax=Belonocnema kinseyi TaxID=2817044 RepID=UPI00143DD2FD|nr:uncharacterized protein LOC117175632 [Belonocnema kinseyi]
MRFFVKEYFTFVKLIATLSKWFVQLKFKLTVRLPQTEKQPPGSVGNHTPVHSVSTEVLAGSSLVHYPIFVRIVRFSRRAPNLWRILQIKGWEGFGSRETRMKWDLLLQSADKTRRFPMEQVDKMPDVVRVNAGFR